MLRLHFEKYIHLLRVFILLHCFLYFAANHGSFAEEMKCVIVLDDSAKWNDANEQCLQSNKVDETKLGDISLNSTLEEFDFDDNCYTECVYTKVGIVTPDGQIDKKQTANIFKGNMTAEMLKRTTSIWDECIDETDKITKSKKLTPCKMTSLHDFCFNKMIVDTGILEMEC